MSPTQQILVIQHETRVPLGQLDRTFQDRCTTIQAHLGEPIPHHTQDVGGLIILGAALGVRDTDNAPWLPAVTDLIRDALTLETPVLGLCLGAQILAEAAGGRVERGDAGGEIGVSQITLNSATLSDTASSPNPGTPSDTTPAAPTDARTSTAPEADPFAQYLHDQLGPTFPVAQSHYDAITQLPAGSTLLASSSQYPHQLFRVGANAWGTQYHPEVTADWFYDWMAADVETLTQQGTTVEEACRRYDNHAAQLSRVADAHAAAFLRVVDQ